MKTRIISATVAAVLLAVVLCLHTTIVLNIALALVGILMVYEVYRACKHQDEYISLASSVVLVVLATFAPKKDIPTNIYVLLVVIYIAVSVAVAIFHHDRIDISDMALLTFETALISATMYSLVLLEKRSVWMVLLALCGAWFADTGAYFAGTFFGKHKLCPTISPKKTVEGLIGGFVSDAVLFAIYACIFFKDENPLIYAAIGLVCCALSVIGDLWASLIKRKFDVKDYGNIMPGHGGAMDRFDSVLFVAPFMAVICTFI